jgi:cytochrome c553
MVWRSAVTSSLAVLALLTVSACHPQSPGDGLAWAYPHAAKAPMTMPSGPFHVPGTPLTMTLAQVNDDANPPDWFPGEHPAPPPIVVHQGPDGVTPCGACHLINGQGFLGAPNLAGLPAAYIVEQVREFRSGRRLSWETNRPATKEMIDEAKTVSDTELAQAAAYFAGLHRAPWVRVVETDTVPKTRPDHEGWLDIDPNGGREPTKGRVIEVAEDWSRMELEDPHSGIVAYVPVGAVARGQALVQSGGKGGLPCAGCHGADLKGMGAAPPLAGRSAAYLARMLWDIRTGARSGPAVAPMQAPAAGLSEADITDITAYLASLKP